jgi:DUF1016 N-terminal domain
VATEPRLDTLYGQVRDILASAKDQAWQAVNTAMVQAYWEVGRVIVEEEQAGCGKANYGSGSEDYSSPPTSSITSIARH